MDDAYIPTRAHLRHAMLFLFQSNLKVNEALKKLKEVYHDNAPAYNTVKHWYSRFEKGEFNLSEESSLESVQLEAKMEVESFGISIPVTVKLGEQRVNAWTELQALRRTQKLSDFNTIFCTNRMHVLNKKL